MKLAVVIKGWDYRVPGCQVVGLQGHVGTRGRPAGSHPRGSRGGPTGPQGVNREV